MSALQALLLVCPRWPCHCMRIADEFSVSGSGCSLWPSMTTAELLDASTSPLTTCGPSPSVLPATRWHDATALGNARPAQSTDLEFLVKADDQCSNATPAVLGHAAAEMHQNTRPKQEDSPQDNEMSPWGAPGVAHCRCREEGRADSSSLLSADRSTECSPRSPPPKRPAVAPMVTLLPRQIPPPPPSCRHKQLDHNHMEWPPVLKGYKPWDLKFIVPDPTNWALNSAFNSIYSTVFASHQDECWFGLWKPLLVDHCLGFVEVFYSRSNSGANAGLHITCQHCLRTMHSRWQKEMSEADRREELMKMLAWYNLRRIGDAPKSVCQVAYMNAMEAHAALHALSSTTASSTGAWSSTSSWD